MQQFCVIGDPIAHSQSPAIHARFAELMGHTIRYTRLHVLPDDVVHTLTGMYEQGYSGCNVTLPHKGVAASHASQTSDAVNLAQAANTLVFDAAGYSAHNTDGMGLVRDIVHNAGVPLQNKKMLLLGAGGAAAGALAALIDTKPSQIAVINRTTARAVDLVCRHAEYADAAGVELLALEQIGSAAHDDARYDVVINATAASIAGTSAHILFALQESHLAQNALVYDMMYGAKADVFLDWARSTRGDIQVRDGLGMLVEQAAEAYAIWLGVRPPSSQVLDEMREAIV